MAHPGNGGCRRCAGDLDRVGIVDWIFTRHQKIRFSFPHHVYVGPGSRAIRCAAVYLRNAGFFGNCVNHCCAFGIATAAYLTELAPLWIRQPLISLIEMLAAIPSVILGLWGIFVMVPWLRNYPFPFLKQYFGWIPLFTGPIYGPCMFAGGIIIAIMILPIITSV